MKNNYLVIFLILIILCGICFYIFACINNQKPSAEIIINGNVIRDFILKNEEKDNSSKTFIAIKELGTILHKENIEYYVLVLIDNYNIENQLLVPNYSLSKLYKFILKDTEIISSDNLNVYDISLNNNYDIFPEKIIKEYLKIKDSVDLPKLIKKQINNFYNANDVQNSLKTDDIFSY